MRGAAVRHIERETMVSIPPHDGKIAQFECQAQCQVRFVTLLG